MKISKNLENEIIAYIQEYEKINGTNLECLYPNSIRFITGKSLNIRKIRRNIDEFIPNNFKRMSKEFISYFYNNFGYLTWMWITENFDIMDYNFINLYEKNINWERFCAYRKDISLSFLEKYLGILPFNYLKLFNNKSLSKDVKKFLDNYYNKSFIETVYEGLKNNQDS